MSRRRRSLIGPAAISAAGISVPWPNLPPIRRTSVTRRTIGRRLITGTRRSIVGRRALLAITLRPALVLRGLPAVRLPLLRPRRGCIPGRRRGTSRRTCMLTVKSPARQSRRSTRNRNRRSQRCAPQPPRIVCPGHHLFPDLCPDSFLPGPTPNTAGTSRFSFPQGPQGELHVDAAMVHVRAIA
jgi:hypothetical protein